MYMDAQTWGVSHISGYPRTVQGSLSILGVCGYSDTGLLVIDGHPQIVQYPWHTQILRHGVFVTVDILG